MEVNTTENKTLEQDYRDLAGLLSNIVDSLPIYFFVKDTCDNFRYVYSSPLMNQLYGRYHNDVVGKTDFDLFLDPVVAQSFRDMDEEVVKTGKMQRFVEQMIDPKGILRTMDTMKLLAPRAVYRRSYPEGFRSSGSVCRPDRPHRPHRSSPAIHTHPRNNDKGN